MCVSDGILDIDKQSVSDLTALVAGSTGSVTNRSRYRVLGLVGHSAGIWLHSARDSGVAISYQ